MADVEEKVRRRSPAARIGLEVLGWLLVLAGIAALVLPGPGLLMLAAGLWVLSTNHPWADRLLDPVRRAAYKAAAESVQSWPRIVLSVAAALTIAAVGVVWCISPPAPSWWPVSDRWWLLGGWGTGVVLIASAVLAIGLIVWSMKNFRYGDKTLEQVYEEHDIS